MTQTEFDFSKRGRDPSRPFHHATTLTVGADAYYLLATIPAGQQVNVMFVNDIVSTSKCGAETKHHPVRRIVLLRRQFAGDYRRILLRCEQDNEIECTLHGVGDEDETSCYGYAIVSHGFTKPKRKK